MKKIENDEIIIVKLLYDENKIYQNYKTIIDKLTYNQISYFLRYINNITSQNEFNPANATTRKMIVNQQRKKRERDKKKPEEESYLGKIISALSWKNTSGINILNVWNLHIYQIFDGITTLNKIDKAQNLLHGIYSGVVDSKSITNDELNWLN